jgi:hypothetical protein
MQGGCFCGAVRYRLASTPYDTGWCHCTVCQKTSGAPAMVFTTVRLADYEIQAGQEAVGTVKTTEFGARTFCTCCGTPLTIHIDFQPEEIDVTVCSLDAPEQVAPGFHLFYASRQPWADAADALPRHDKFRPETRGRDAQ